MSGEMSEETRARRDNWVLELKPEDREIVAKIGGTYANPSSTKDSRSSKKLVPNWKEVVIEHCTNSITVNRALLAKLLGISLRTLNTRMKKDGDELGDLIRASRGWLVKQLEAKVLTKALADDADPGLALKVLGRVDPDNHNESVMSARAGKGPAVVVNDNRDQRQLTFGKPLSFDQWMEKVQSGAVAAVLAPPKEETSDKA